MRKTVSDVQKLTAEWRGNKGKKVEKVQEWRVTWNTQDKGTEMQQIFILNGPTVLQNFLILCFHLSDELKKLIQSLSLITTLLKG